MNISRRLVQLENRPFHPRQADCVQSPAAKAAMRLLNLPLPDETTSEERARCLRLFNDGFASIKADKSDTGWVAEMAAYTLSLHAKYDTR